MDCHVAQPFAIASGVRYSKRSTGPFCLLRKTFLTLAMTGKDRLKWLAQVQIP